jgi:phosphoribosylanthranilate isomerase
MTRIKICCISDESEAQLAVRAGASLLGLVSQMPSGPGVIGEEMIARIAAGTPPGVTSTLLTCAATAETILSQQQRTGVRALQLVDEVSLELLRELKNKLPGVALMPVIHVRDGAAIEEAKRLAPEVHALLLDSGNPAAAIKELGGTGRVHDWEVSAELVRSVSVPVFLAGGLNPENIGRALSMVRPFGVDICSGVRTAGRLDADKLSRFAAAIRAHDAATAV